MSKSKNNYRSVHKIVDRIELKARYSVGNSTLTVSEEYEAVEGTPFIDREATNVYVTADKLEAFKQAPQVLNVGAVKEVRYSNLDKFKKAL